VRGGIDRPWNIPSDATEIYVVNADGSELTRLTNNRVGEGYPAWQPVSPS
jgi:Tol biopolymer transport system component